MAPLFLNLDTRRRRAATSSLRRLSPEERARSSKWMGGCVGPSAGLDLLGKRESSWSAGSRTPDRPAPGLSQLPADAWQFADFHEQIQL